MHSFVLLYSYLFTFLTTKILAIPPLELELLHQLYDQTNGDLWNWRTLGPRWNFDVPYPNPCNTRGERWQGLGCSLPVESCTNHNSTSCQIIRIDLDLYRLKGPLLSNWTGFTNLVGLSMNANNLTGTIPDMFPSSLVSLWLSRNQLTGTIPSKIALLPSLAVVHFEVNLLHGTVPTEVGQMTALRSVLFSQNQLTGTIPSTFGQLSDLLVLYLFGNHLTGTIPSSFGGMSSLSFLVLDVNSLTGSIPSTIGLLSSLIFLDFDLNYLTGPLPSSIIQLTKVETFTLDGNLISSTLPCDLHLLEALTYFDIDYNYFTGLCPTLIFPSSLEVMDLSHNYFLTPLPSPLISSLSQLQLIDLDDNFFFGSLPTNLYILSNLYYLGAGDNSLSGTLPNSIGELTFLDQLYLENNHFSGTLDPLLVITHTSSPSRMNLNSIDLSNNRFSGSILSDLFSLPKLTTLALTSNCFHGTLTSTICSAHNLAVLSFDGLGAGHDCSFRDFVILPQLNYRNSMGGELPSCLWEMTNMTHLSLAGNAFIGTLHSLPTQSSLINLTLSHNHLSGSIPKSFFTHNFQSLDLSYNKFSGEYLAPISSSNSSSNSSSSSSTLPVQRRIVLEVNRLSGEFPAHGAAASTFSYVNILTGNIFACHNLPSKDIHVDTYRCGSQIFDFAMIMFAPLFGLFVLLCLVLLISKPSLSHSISSLEMIQNQFKKYLSPAAYLNNFMTQLNCLDILKSLTVFIYLEETVRYVFIACLISTLPLYFLRFIDGSSSTHTHLYRWVWTTAYFSGPIPSSLLLLSWITVVSVFFYRIQRLKSHHQIRSSSSLSTSGEAMPSTRPSSTITLSPILSPGIKRGIHLFGPYFPTILHLLETVFIVSINIGVMGTVNAFYIISSNDKAISSTELFFIQFSFATFKVIWNKVCLPILDLSKQSHRVKIFLIVLNSVFIPSIVIALTSPTCFQGLINPPNEIETSYASVVCGAIFVGNETIFCLGNSPTRVQVTPFTPPLSYNYLCGSTLLSTYLPVYCYLYTIQIIAVPLNTYLLASHVPYTRLPFWARLRFSGIIWPHHWYWHKTNRNKSRQVGLQEMSQRKRKQEEEAVEEKEKQERKEGDRTEEGEVEVEEGGEGEGKGEENNSLTEMAQEKPTAGSLLSRDTIISKYAEDILNLITFGLCCPLLGLAISISMVLNNLIQRGLIGRFLLAREEFATILSLTSPRSTISPLVNNLSHSSPPSLSSPPSQSIPRPVSSKSLSITSDVALIALNQSLLDLDSSYYNLIWVVLWSSCFFISFLCWDIAGDKMGALESIWLPCLAVFFVLSLQLFEWFSDKIFLEENPPSIRESGISLSSVQGPFPTSSSPSPSPSSSPSSTEPLPHSHSQNPSTV